MENTTNDPEEPSQVCANDVAIVLWGSSENIIYLMMRPGHDAQIRNEMLLKILVANENMFGM
jgi:hypothetical protein